jgi:hypothetical protein
MFGNKPANLRQIDVPADLILNYEKVRDDSDKFAVNIHDGPAAVAWVHRSVGSQDDTVQPAEIHQLLTLSSPAHNSFG